MVGPNDRPVNCAVGCPQCELGGTGDGEVRAVSEGHVRGRRLVLGALGVFWAPLVLAIAGAVVGGDRQVHQLIGAAAGLGIGMAVSGVVVRLVRPTH